MICVIHQNGTSFKGLMAYLMHDKGADTSDRVAWAQTHNVGTEDPTTAWKVMAATSRLQDQLKADAGIKNTGRKSKQHVMHYTLSWAEEEKGEVDRDEMVAAALASMSYIGTTEGEKLGKNKKALRTQYADEHQAIIVSHNDANPHVHIVVNRVNQEHGVILPDSKDYEKLSAWALDYRTAQGKEDYCPQRVKNAAERAQGLLTNHPRKPRNVYEAEQEKNAADPGSRKAALLEQQERRAKELKIKTRQLKVDRVEQMQKLEDRFLAEEKHDRAQLAESIRMAKAQVKTEYAPKIDALSDKQLAEKRRFEQAKETLAGRVRNTWSVFKTKAWLTELRTSPIRATSEAFNLAFSSGLQEQQLGKFHAQEQRKLVTERHKVERAAATEQRAKLTEKLDEKRAQFELDRSDLRLEQGMEKAKLKAEWKQLMNDRKAAMAEDGRAPRPDAAPSDGGGDGSAGGRSGKNKLTPRQQQISDELSQQAQPMARDDRDMPSERVRDIAAELKKAAELRDQGDGKDKGPEQDR